MDYSYNIPESILENPDTRKFVSILDRLNSYKQKYVGDYVRSWNPATLTDKEWMVKKLHDFGFSELTTDLPLAVLQQVMLNADTIAGTKGSLIGVELYCSVISLGEVTVTPEILPIDKWHDLSPNHTTRGFITWDYDYPKYYLASNTEEFFLGGELNIRVDSKYFKEPIYDGKLDENGDMVYEDFSEIIANHLNNNIRNQTIFGAFTEHEIVFNPREEFYYHELLNKNFA